MKKQLIKLIVAIALISVLSGCLKEGEEYIAIQGSFVFKEKDQYDRFYKVLKEDKTEAYRMGGHMDIEILSTGVSVTLDAKNGKDCKIVKKTAVGYIKCDLLDKK